MTHKQQIDSDIQRAKDKAGASSILDQLGRGDTEIALAVRLAWEVEHLREYSKRLCENYDRVSKAYDKLKCYSEGYSRG